MMSGQNERADIGTQRLTRRGLIVAGLVAGGVYGRGREFWSDALVEPVAGGPGPYGVPGPPDRNGVRLPDGFSSRVIARGNEPVRAGDGSRLPVRPIYADGQATFATDDRGWILVSNAEVSRRRSTSSVPSLEELEDQLIGDAAVGAGACAIRFDRSGEIDDAYRILGGTDRNCAGGPTPWGTWLSCEEVPRGQVYECDPTGARGPAKRPALGTFKHEAAAVDPLGERLYMTEDVADGGFYRFTPKRYPDLSSGELEIAVVAGNGSVGWRRIPDPEAVKKPTRNQVPAATEFNRGEGMWFDSGVVYVATTGDGVVHAYEVATQRIERIYDAAELRDPPLTGIDNLTVSPAGDVYVCEDNGASTLDVGLITPERVAARFLSLGGPEQAGSELTGPVFDPSGRRLYFSSQRADGLGITYEVSGPFRGVTAAD